MARTPSNMLELGTKAPEFTLIDTITEQEMSINNIKGDTATVVMFICNHCPFVKHVNDELVRLGNDYKDKGIGFVAISSNDVENYPDDSPGLMKIVAQELEYPFPYLYDETQEVAKAYDAACTPDFYVFDKNLKLVYRGQLDDSRPGNDIPVTGKDLRSALNALIDGKEVSDDQKPSLGCNIKWKQPV
ncbi:MAG TPA: thioredoxin family protein [Cytophagales bacterium]|jgi:peroxiredoxin|nr:thioredoxin family protein [Cytophagales bacterium]